MGFQTTQNSSEYFFVGIWSWLADKLHFILSYEAGFYKPNRPQSPPSLFAGLQHMQQCQVNFHSIFAPGF
jgi:hypothetical protein